MDTAKVYAPLAADVTQKQKEHRYCEVKSSAMGSVPGVEVSLEFAQRHLQSTKQCCRGKASMLNDLRDSVIGTEYGDALAKWTVKSADSSQQQQQQTEHLETTPEQRSLAKERTDAEALSEKRRLLNKERADAEAWAEKNKANAKAAYERSRGNPLDAYMYDFMQWFESSERREMEEAESKWRSAQKKMIGKHQMPQAANTATKQQNPLDGSVQQKQQKEQQNEKEQQIGKGSDNKPVFLGSTVHTKVPRGLMRCDRKSAILLRADELPSSVAPPKAGVTDNVDLLTAAFLNNGASAPHIVTGFQWSFLQH